MILATRNLRSWTLGVLGVALAILVGVVLRSLVSDDSDGFAAMTTDGPATTSTMSPVTEAQMVNAEVSVLRIESESLQSSEGETEADPTTTAAEDASTSSDPATTDTSGPSKTETTKSAPATSASTAPASTAPASTAPASTGSASTAPASTGSASTAPASTAPASTAPASTAPTTKPGGHTHGGHKAPAPNHPDGFPAGSNNSGDLLLKAVGRPAEDLREGKYSNIAEFRISCGYSHMNYDDAIVYPGESGRAHLHVYFGNTTVDANTNADRLFDTGSSTCAGGRANRSAYWMPAIIDTNNGNKVVTPKRAIIYYKSGWAGSYPEKVVAPPNGLKVIAGDQTLSGPKSGHDTLSTEWGCTSGTDTPNLDSIPTDCKRGDELKIQVRFPNCWDGKNLDSPDHRSHMAWTTGGPDRRQDCPASHPVLIPRLGINAFFDVESEDTSGYRLSSDMYDASLPGGYSAHADWIVAWDPKIIQRAIDGCFRPAWNCGTNNLGDGEGLADP